MLTLDDIHAAISGYREAFGASPAYDITLHPADWSRIQSQSYLYLNDLDLPVKVDPEFPRGVVVVW